MEKNFNTDNFEKLLRETTDDFRMYPSKRVWHSLYNDLHPGRKWPSVAILLLLITSIMYIGVTNSNEAGAAAKTAVAASDNVKNSGNNLIANAIRVNAQPVEVIAQPGIVNEIISSAASADNSAVYIASIHTNTATNTYSTPGVESIGNITQGNLDIAGSTKNLNNSKAVDEILDQSFTTNALTNISITNRSPGSTSGTNHTQSLQAVPVTTGIDKTAKKTVTARKEKINAEEKEWMEDYVLHNKKPANKWKNRVAYQVYVTPSVGYRSLNKNIDFSPPPTTSLISNPGQVNTMEYSLNHSSAINLEAGTNVIFSFSKKFRFKAGLQLNYTNYRINAYELNHPTFAILMLNDLNNGYPVLTSRTTSLANTPGLASKNLNNNTYQVSIPLGADFKIAGNNKFKWYAGATVQPTYVIGGHSYLISFDLKNYITGDDLMRKFNLNGGIETFVSYKTKNRVILSAGPQFRYQFLSTYSKQYTYDEKLYNLGVKLGMTTNF